ATDHTAIYTLPLSAALPICNVASSEFGLLVTLGDFTPQARNFANSKANLRLIDGEQLVSLVLDRYEQLDSKYKGLLPLRRVYVPEAVDVELVASLLLGSLQSSPAFLS